LSVLLREGKIIWTFSADFAFSFAFTLFRRWNPFLQTILVNGISRLWRYRYW
jgi:hypothetical protein